MPLRPQASRAAAMTAQPELPDILHVIAEESATVDSSFTTEPDEFGLF